MLRSFLIVLLTLLLFCDYELVQEQFADEFGQIEAILSGEEESEEMPGAVSKVDPNKPMIALTFDDGPGKYTGQILDRLEEYDARASFFVLGICVDEYPEVVQRMQELGCEIGNHTTNHKRLTTLDTQGIVDELSQTNQRLQNVIGEEAALMRPPYGSVNEQVETCANMPLAMWSVDPMDWENQNADYIVNHVLQNAKDGDVVIMHDIYETSAQATIQLIPALIEQGYQLVTVSELAEARGVELQDGTQYFEFHK